MNIETEYKFIIKKPDINILTAMDGYTESKITQIYLENPVATHRVRRREYPDGVVYTENKKVRISKLSSNEYEREISENEYIELAKNMESGAKPLYKTRRTFSYKGKTFELDYYEEWKKSCVMEVEIDSESDRFEIPEFIEIVADVTGEKGYSNHKMAHAFPAEII